MHSCFSSSLTLCFGTSQAADVYVSAYSAEGFNMPVLEAAACGLPLIVTSKGPTSEFTHETFAKYIDATLDPKEEFDVLSECFAHNGSHNPLISIHTLKPSAVHLATLLAVVYEDSAWVTTAAVAAATFVRERFTWQHVADKLLALVHASTSDQGEGTRPSCSGLSAEESDPEGDTAAATTMSLPARCLSHDRRRRRRRSSSSGRPFCTSKGGTGGKPSGALALLHVDGKCSCESWTPVVHSAESICGFEASSVHAVYAPRTLAYLPSEAAIADALVQWHRVLVPGGLVMLVVPGMDVLSALWQNQSLAWTDRQLVASVMLTGAGPHSQNCHQATDGCAAPNAVQRVLDFPSLVARLTAAGFDGIQAAGDGFGVFDDESGSTLFGQPTHLSVQARAAKTLGTVQHVRIAGEAKCSCGTAGMHP
jgi:hypothetical protein